MSEAEFTLSVPRSAILTYTTYVNGKGGMRVVWVDRCQRKLHSSKKNSSEREIFPKMSSSVLLHRCFGGCRPVGEHIFEDNCCYCNSAGLKLQAHLEDVDLVYCSYHNKVKYWCYFDG